ncbi:30S ribosomal protein S2 [Candidatus Wolfebacteria bacterium RIFOXYD12_FULL_48_21]|uniref:Small ribosomal subunit protein uS2 n=1 Tax=Candidatus Wolfebacteria bacterium RIFOXYD1_FULL_48_65 TaxID=1802561 RepID=A0A1F8E1E4_9BACT|nr:MAG: 30S ribosomal protein S2 [Candidatus Wolfebacteria bacterium RIFOXYD1_FULL_48_65]OGM94331.1 MAG: 30S ribosomal protein S2 [Candidatus Wolfebacteria bacterium RIFOXYD12_FULL_48_21]OGM96978.1 MAG: 30S ribosomal protein S2 [Candidatus Wolfebacteria bacterium RIFOXYD2_FULL_48_11]
MDNKITTEAVEGMTQADEIDVDMTLIKEMADNGLLYGHKKQRTHPRFKQFIYTTRNGVEIIDLAKTSKKIDEAVAFLNAQLQEKKTVLVVGTQAASWDAVEAFAKKFGMPYVKNGWVGGLVTNFKVVGQRLDYLRKALVSIEKGEFDKYTKKERVTINRKIDKMKIMFEGLDTLTKAPDVMFVIDGSLRNHITAIKEAATLKIPVVAIIDSDDNPDLVTYPIPANDHAKLSITWLMDHIGNRLKA